MWTERAEADVSCDGPLGAISDGEKVARLLVEMTPPSGWRPFNRAHFACPADGQFSNVCGDSTGCSVDRADDLSADELRSRSESFAAAAQAAAEARKPQKITRTGGGALQAQVRDLRRIRSSGNGTLQTVFVYADPLRGNDEHAVIRVRDNVAEEEWSILLDDIVAAFA